MHIVIMDWNKNYHNLNLLPIFQKNGFKVIFLNLKIYQVFHFLINYYQSCLRMCSFDGGFYVFVKQLDALCLSKIEKIIINRLSIFSKFEYYYINSKF